MPDLPTIRPEDVSPFSSRLLQSWATYLVTWASMGGLHHILSQHKSERAARGSLHKHRHERGIGVYRVERGEGG